MSAVIRISSPDFDSTSKRVVKNEVIEAWIEESDGEPGRWVDISSAVKSVKPILEIGQPAKADIVFYIAGLSVASMIPTDEGIEDLREFVEKSSDTIEQLRTFLAQIDSERASA